MMSAIHQWCENQPTDVALMTQITLTSASWVYGYLQSVKFGEDIHVLDNFPTVQEWLKLYQDHHRFGRKLTQIALEVGGMPKFIASTLYGLNRGRLRMVIGQSGCLIIKPEKENLTLGVSRRSGSILNYRLNAVLDRIKSLTSQETAPYAQFDQASDLEKVRKVAQMVPEMIFFVKVWIPCLALYQEMPLMLLRRARLGDADALDKILRLDKAAISDPKISDIYFKSSLQKNKNQFNALNRALQHTASNGQQISRIIKQSLTALISILAEGLNHSLNLEQIELLYRAICRDIGRGRQIETGPDESKQNLAKVIQKERASWRRLLLS